MRQVYSILLLLFVFNVSFAQTSINDYQYAMISSRFNFQKAKDQYRLNTTTKAFFQKIGFTAFLDDEILPSDFSSINCNKVYVQVEEEKGVFTTVLKVIIKDCKNNVLLTSQSGSSREKEYAEAYSEALRIALKSLESVNYKYNEKKIKDSDVVSVSSDVFQIERDNIAIYITNMTKNTMLTLLKTSNPNNFIAKSKDKNGIVFKNGEDWFFEYYVNNKDLVSEKLEVKF